MGETTLAGLGLHEPPEPSEVSNIQPDAKLESADDASNDDVQDDNADTQERDQGDDGAADDKSGDAPDYSTMSNEDLIAHAAKADTKIARSDGLSRKFQSEMDKMRVESSALVGNFQSQIQSIRTEIAETNQATAANNILAGKSDDDIPTYGDLKALAEVSATQPDQKTPPKVDLSAMRSIPGVQEAVTYATEHLTTDPLFMSLKDPYAQIAYAANKRSEAQIDDAVKLALEKGKNDERKRAKKNHNNGTSTSTGSSGGHAGGGSGVELDLNTLGNQLMGHAERMGLTGSLAPRVGKR